MRAETFDQELRNKMHKKLSTFRPAFGEDASIKINILLGKLDKRKGKKYSNADKNLIMRRIIDLIK